MLFNWHKTIEDNSIQVILPVVIIDKHIWMIGVLLIKILIYDRKCLALEKCVSLRISKGFNYEKNVSFIDLSTLYFNIP